MKNLVLWIAISFLVQCNQKGNDYQKEFNERVILSNVLTTPDPQGKCVTYMQSAESCLVNAASPPAPVSETTLSLIFSNNTDTTYADYCLNLLNSEAYSKFSEKAKECSMNCANEFWKTRAAHNVCTDPFLDQLTAMQDGMKTCNINCFTLINNDVPK